MKKKCCIVGIVVLFTLPIYAFAQERETLTLSTYYPAPYGVYDRLITNTLGVGDTNDDTKLNSSDGPANQGDVWIAGKVGIGRVSPSERLEVEGKAVFASEVTIGEYTLPATEGNRGYCLKSDGQGRAVWVQCVCPPDPRTFNGGEVAYIAGTDGAALPRSGEMVRNDSPSAQRVCNVAGYNNVQRIASRGWATCYNNYNHYWDGSQWIRQWGCTYNSWIEGLTCSGLTVPCY